MIQANLFFSQNSFLLWKASSSVKDNIFILLIFYFSIFKNSLNLNVFPKDIPFTPVPLSPTNKAHTSPWLPFHKSFSFLFELQNGHKLHHIFYIFQHILFFLLNPVFLIITMSPLFKLILFKMSFLHCFKPSFSVFTTKFHRN